MAVGPGPRPCWPLVDVNSNPTGVTSTMYIHTTIITLLVQGHCTSHKRAGEVDWFTN